MAVSGGSRGSSSSSLKDYCRHHPPGVVFLVCLFSFAVSTTILSMYIRQGTSIRNPDYLDWNTLLTQTANLHFCIDNSSTVVDSVKANSQSHKLANLSVMVDVDLAWKQELSGYGKVLAISQVHLSDMGRGVPNHYRKQDVRISFVLDPSDASEQMCLNVQAPASLIRDMSEGKSRPDNCTVAAGDNARTVNVSSMSGNEVPHGWCEEGTVFRMGLEGNPSWTVDVSGEDLALIHLHLVATSVFLFAIVALAVLGIVVRGVFHRRRHQSSTSVPRRQLKNEDDDDELIY